jgi:hypothetical protein
MNAQSKQSITPSMFTPTSGSVLQRKCACGQHTIAGGECAECRQKREGAIQRAAVSSASMSTVSPAVPMGSNFSQVPIHNEQQAGSSLQPQGNLKVSQPDDPYEREADRASQQVVNMSTSPLDEGGKNGATFAPVREVVSDFGTDAPPAMAQWLGNVGTGRSLASSTINYMGQRFNADFSAVHVHTGEAAEHAAALLGARAFTFKNHIFLGKGQSEANQQLMAHELAHTLQQSSQTLNEGVEATAGQMTSSTIALSAVPGLMLQRDIDFPAGSGWKIGQITKGAWYETDARLDNVRFIEHAWSHWPNKNCQCDHKIKVRVEEYSTVGFLSAINIYDYYEWYWWNHEYSCKGTPEGSCAESYRKEGPQNIVKAYDEKGNAPKSNTDVLSLIGNLASIAGLIATLALAEAEPSQEAQPSQEASA